MRNALFLLPLLIGALPACGSGDVPSGGLTPEQNQALDTAAQKLDDDRANLPNRDGEQHAPPADKSAEPSAPAAQ